MNATVDIKAIAWIEGTENVAAWFAWSALCNWFDEFGWNARAERPTPDYDASADLGNGRFAFRIAQVVVLVNYDQDADYDGERYVDRSKVTRVEVVNA